MKRLLLIITFLNATLVLSQDRVIYPAVGFEHPSHLDVYVSVVECNNLPTILVTTFNESPIREHLEVSFKINIIDANGQSEIFYYPKRIYEFGKMEIESCDNAVNPNRSILDWNNDNSNKQINLIFDYED